MWGQGFVKVVVTSTVALRHSVLQNVSPRDSP